MPETVGGWRTVDADGVNPLPAEAFVACNQFFVPTENGVAPVERGEPTYMTCTVWSDRAAFEAWRAGQAFKNAHADGGASGNPSRVASGDSSNGASSSSKKSEGGPPAPLWNGRPVPVFYEATLVISSAAGA